MLDLLRIGQDGLMRRPGRRSRPSPQLAVENLDPLVGAEVLVEDARAVEKAEAADEDAEHVGVHQRSGAARA